MTRFVRRSPLASCLIVTVAVVATLFIVGVVIVVALTVGSSHGEPPSVDPSPQENQSTSPATGGWTSGG
ncbi:flagellar basal body-associated FliL family protein [Brevibacterium metallidurans]|uniref:hypothetical protein n=1 Tax=Brevibacterium metallidurans TaxID=1482676 RepID=UPI000A9601BC